MTGLVRLDTEARRRRAGADDSAVSVQRAADDVA